MRDAFDEIGVCKPAEAPAALELILQRLPPSQRGPWVDALASVRNEPLGLFEALVVARRRGRVVAACWGQPQPGKTCSLWVPESSSGRISDTTAEALIAEVGRIVDHAGMPVTQVLSEQSHSPLHKPLQRCGFRRISELQYLGWRPGLRPLDLGPAGVEHVGVTNPRSQTLKDLIRATYEDTLDFPELDGVRQMSDVLTGYLSLGRFRPDLWRLIRKEGQDAGVLLMAEHVDSNQLELVYVGIAPSARGHGLGAAAVGFAQQTAIQLGVERLVLAVDIRNRPAREIYKRAGLRAWASRFAYLRRHPAAVPCG